MARQSAPAGLASSFTKAGLAELMPWVTQWHAGYDPDWGGDPAEEYQSYFDDQLTRHLAEDALRAGVRPRASVARRGGGE